jgi:AmmeMemoRadiSam system protein B
MTIKRCQLAGTWYTGDAVQLRREVDDLLRTAGGGPAAALLGLIVPHAGYAYSGRAAAAGYRRLKGGDYRRAVILAPSHFAAFHGVAVLEVDAFETPLGTVPVDRAGAETLLSGPFYRSEAEPFQGEHSLEIQLPLLQRALPNVAVVPALIGDLGPDDFATAASTLRRLDDDKTVFVVSSDFVHYGWRFGYLPFAAEGPQQVRTGLHGLDMGAITRICSGDAQACREYLAETGATICGALPITLFLTFHRRRTPGELIEYYSSLDVTGDFEHCVSYASIGFPRPV